MLFRSAKRTKAFDPGILTLVGGSHAQQNPQRFFEPDIDFICRSDNIYAILDVLQQKPFENIDGLCYDTCEGWKMNPMEAFDINRLPIPDRSHMERYLTQYRYLDVHPVALLKTSTSCPHHCSWFTSEESFDSSTRSTSLMTSGLVLSIVAIRLATSACFSGISAPSIVAACPADR